MMALLPKAQVSQLSGAAKALSQDAPEQLLEDFVAQQLAWTPADRVKYFPSPDPNGYVAIITALFTRVREKILRDSATLPSFVVYSKPVGGPFIAGLIPFLQTRNVNATLIGRLRQFTSVRAALLKMRKGHYLEAVAAALLQKQCTYGQATKGSGDQGVDAIAWKGLFDMERCFLDGSCDLDEPLPGEKVFILASAKANLAAKEPKLISPAHIRDLIGGWLIQRSTIGVWQNQGILMLSPTQMVICTTYRLSEQSKRECRKIGVQIWSLPELIYLVCKYAPDDVFDQQAQYQFNASAFKKWWKPQHQTRLAIQV